MHKSICGKEDFHLAAVKSHLKIIVMHRNGILIIGINILCNCVMCSEFTLRCQLLYLRVYLRIVMLQCCLAEYLLLS